MTTTTMLINSETYWDKRFEENWQNAEGPRQSRFFAQLALENLPDWLFDQIRQQELSVADWGCAQGDGTDVLASYMGPGNLNGIDFSSVAIEQARNRYPRINFFCQNWLETQSEHGLAFDIVFSSNTLEHFDQPYQVLDALANHARKAVILALPYRELERIDEHFFSFLSKNIPTELSSGFRLIWSRVIDCTTIPNTPWGGDQIFLIYAEPSWIKTLKLTLFHIEIDKNDNTSIQASLAAQVAEREAQINNLSQAVAEREAQINNLSQAVAEREAQINNLSQAMAEREAQINNLSQAMVEREAQISSLNLQLSQFLHSRSWKVTCPLRLTNKFIKSITSEEGRYSLLKALYWHLPEKLRIKLNGIRHAYVAKHVNQCLTTITKSPHLSDTSDKNLPEWLIRANKANKVVITSCAFEFDELVNQRPINAAKHFATQGYLVLFVAWQWSPKEKLIKGCQEIWPDIFQVPLFEFSANVEKLSPSCKGSIFLVNMPASIFVSIIPSLRERKYTIAYDIMDDWESFNQVGQAPWFQMSTETKLILQADFVSAVSPTLCNKFSRIRSDISVIGNGYSPEIIGVKNKGIAGIAGNETPIVGYFGHLTDAWFDWNLLLELAKKCPHVLFEIIGYGEPDWVKAELFAISNIRLLGKVSPKDLHQQVSSWSVGIIPFINSTLSQAVDPIKIYEYLYFGLPVVVTGIEHLKKYPMTFFTERANMLTSLEMALKHNRNSDSDYLDLFLQKTTWRARFDRLTKELNSRPHLGNLYEN